MGARDLLLGDWQQQLGNQGSWHLRQNWDLTLGCWRHLIQGRTGVGGGAGKRRRPFSPQEEASCRSDPKAQFWQDLPVAGDCQMRLALVRDRPMGDSKNTQGRAATQQEHRPVAGQPRQHSLSQLQSLGLFQAAKPWAEAGRRESALGLCGLGSECFRGIRALIRI